MRPIGQRRRRGAKRGGGDVERTANAIEHIDHRLGAVEPADAQGREAVDLREGPRHHDVLGLGRQRHAALIVVAADIFRIGRIKHQQHATRQPCVEPADLAERQIGTGRIVRIGEEDDPRPLAHPVEDAVDIGTARGADRDRIDQEAVFRVDRLIAGREIGTGEQRQQFVRTGTANDPRRQKTMRGADRLAQSHGK